MGTARPKPRRSGPALALSLGVHALALAALLLSIRLPPPAPEPPPVVVSMIDLSAAPQPPRPPRPPRLLSSRPAPAPPVGAPPPPPALRGTAEAPPPAPAASPHMSFFAERVAGCERETLMLLSAPDLERCRARIAAVAALTPGPFVGAGADVGRLAGLASQWRAALDAEAARRARAGAPMDRPPVDKCEGRLGDLGAGCLTARE